MRFLPTLPLRAGAIAAALLLTTLLGVGASTATARRPLRDGSKVHIAVHQQTQLGTASSARCKLTVLARLNRSRGRRRHARRRAVISRTCPTKGGGEQQTQAAPSSIYWGAWMGRQLTGEEPPWDMNAVSKFEQMAGKNLSIVQFGSPFASCYSTPCSFYSFPTTPMESVRQHGSIPFLSWSSQSIPSQTNEPDYQLSDVASGVYDSYIRKYAEAAAAWGHPFFLRFDWEMNGNWFPWDAAANGNSPADYVAAWRHVHDIFTSVGATNATWVWCPNVDPGGGMVNLASLYPGDSYVDWTGLDGYNWGTNPASPHQWVSFDELFRTTYNKVVNEIAPTKPLIIGETASTEYGGSKAGWITDMLSKIPTEYPKIRGMLWFERYDNNMDWPIETSSTATSAFATGIQNPAYATNTFANLSPSGPIPPPSG
jgi:mannan endo-1,4-beta-mannosidase